MRIANHRAQLNVGDGAVVLIERPVTDGQDSHSLMELVENVGRHYERATESGARPLLLPADCPYSERQYSVEDLAGHRWTFSQSIVDVDPKDWGGSAGRL